MGTRPSSERRLRESVQAAVDRVAVPDGDDVQVSVCQGRVVLRGRARSLAGRWAAGAAAHRISGREGVVNEIAVPALDPAHLRDADLAVSIIRGLLNDPQVPTVNLEVSVRDGWLTLLGEVDRHVHKLAAERVARGIPKVRGITNLIRVRHGLSVAVT